jgi:hypothetical protein
MLSTIDGGGNESVGDKYADEVAGIKVSRVHRVCYKTHCDSCGSLQSRILIAVSYAGYNGLRYDD